MYYLSQLVQLYSSTDHLFPPNTSLPKAPAATCLVYVLPSTTLELRPLLRERFRTFVSPYPDSWCLYYLLLVNSGRANHKTYREIPWSLSHCKGFAGMEKKKGWCYTAGRSQKTPLSRYLRLCTPFRSLTQLGIDHAVSGSTVVGRYRRADNYGFPFAKVPLKNLSMPTYHNATF